jgi:hypothetical protein
VIDNWQPIVIVAEELLRARQLSGCEIAALLSSAPAGPRPPRWQAGKCENVFAFVSRSSRAISQRIEGVSPFLKAVGEVMASRATPPRPGAGKRTAPAAGAARGMGGSHEEVDEAGPGRTGGDEGGGGGLYRAGAALPARRGQGA